MMQKLAIAERQSRQIHNYCPGFQHPTLIDLIELLNLICLPQWVISRIIRQPQ
jgi:hypothetical protein